MGLDDLTERERQVFLSIVRSFVETAEPVGSRSIARHCDLNISPATIRNVMMDLEEKGLITQPHTSAGRVPTNLGYRQYVDSLITIAELDDSLKQSITSQFMAFSQDVDQIVSRASRVLSQLSSQLGVVLAPRFNQGKLEKVDLVQLNDNKILLILSVKSGLIKTVIVEIEQEVPRHLLEAASQILNERLHGLSVDDLQRSLNERFSDLDVNIKAIVGAIKDRTDRMVMKEYSSDFFIAGTKNLIQNPDFASKEKVGAILELIDRQDLLLQVLSETETGAGVTIVIGEENKEDLMKNCSLITTTYNLQDATGTIGIIGPTRMQYDKIIALVKFMSETMAYLISK